MPTTIAYMLSGCANGHPLSIAGAGTFGGGRLRLDLRADAALLDFDPAIAAMACIDAAARSRDGGRLSVDG